MTNIVFHKLMHIYRSDASEFGLSGCNVITGHALQFEIPVHCQLCSSLNSLKFIACMFKILANILNDDALVKSCFLSQTNSSSAAG
jgi:hypothetical protein